MPAGARRWSGREKGSLARQRNSSLLVSARQLQALVRRPVHRAVGAGRAQRPRATPRADPGDRQGGPSASTPRSPPQLGRLRAPAPSEVAADSQMANQPACGLGARLWLERAMGIIEAVENGLRKREEIAALSKSCVHGRPQYSRRI